jgi:hypothetical protein
VTRILIAWALFTIGALVAIWLAADDEEIDSDSDGD